MDDWLLQSKMIYQCNIYSRSDSVKFVQVSGRKDSENNAQHDVIMMTLTLTNSQEDNFNLK